MKTTTSLSTSIFVVPTPLEEQFHRKTHMLNKAHGKREVKEEKGVPV
jgi:hypothetical protein